MIQRRAPRPAPVARPVQTVASPRIGPVIEPRQHGLDLMREQVIDRLLCRVRMRRAANHRHHIGHHRHSHALLVGHDHRDGCTVLQRHVDIISIRQAHFHLSLHDHVAHDRVARDDLHFVRFEASKEVVGLVVTEHDIQRGNVKRCGSEAWIGNGDLPSPFRIGEVEHRCRRLCPDRRRRAGGRAPGSGDGSPARRFWRSGRTRCRSADRSRPGSHAGVGNTRRPGVPPRGRPAACITTG